MHPFVRIAIFFRVPARVLRQTILWSDVGYVDPSLSSSPMVNFINVKRANFTYESLFWQLYLVTFWLVKNSYEKCARLMLMKLTPRVNFINNLCESFSYESKLSSFSLVTFCFVIIWCQNIGKKFRVKCWWNWLLVKSISMITQNGNWKAKSFFACTYFNYKMVELWSTIIFIIVSRP